MVIRFEKDTLWYKLIIALFTINCILFCLPSLYLKILPYYTIITLISLIFILALRSRLLETKMLFELFTIVLLISFFVIIQGRSLVSVFTIYSSFVAFYCFDRMPILKKDLRYIKSVSIVIWIILCLRSINYFFVFSSNRESHINSNTLAMVLMYLSMLIIYYFDDEKIGHYKIKEFFVVILTAMSVYYGYQARGCLLSYAFFVAAVLIRRWLFDHKKIVIMLGVLIIIVGTIFPFMYMLLINNGFFGTNSMTLKNMFTRVSVWQGVVKYFIDYKESLFLGLPYNQLLRFGESLHNNYLELIAYIGIPGMILYYLFVFRYLWKIINISDYTHRQDILIISFLSLLVLGFTEVSTFWSVTYMIIYLFLGIASGISSLSVTTDGEYIGGDMS